MISREQLRDAYLKDLELPDTFHGRTTPKVRYLEQWKSIEPHYKHGSPLDVLGRKVWVWSDIHFGHNNIIGYTNRPFDDVASMNEAMIQSYINTVGPNDVVIWNGDIGFKSAGIIRDLLARLPGYKIQVVGNHDIDRAGKLIDYDMDERHLCYDLKLEGIQLLFTHYPMDRVPKGCVNVHGHIHQNTAYHWSINVCVEHTNYTPRSLDSIVEQAHKYLDTV